MDCVESPNVNKEGHRVMQQHAPPPVPVRPKSKRNPWLTCGIGCAVFAGVIILIVTIVFVWLMFPSRRTVPMTTLVGSNTVAVVHLTDCGDDEGVAALLEKLKELQKEMQLEMIRQAGSGGGGPLAEMMVQMQHINSVHPSQIPEVLLAAEPSGTEDDPDVLVGIGLNSLPKLITIPIKFIMRAAGQEQGVTTYRGMNVVDMDGESQLVLDKGLLLISSQMDAMHGAIDRLRDGRAATSVVAEMPADFVVPWDIYALGDNRKGRLERLFEEMEDDDESPDEGARSEREEIPFPWEDALFMRVGVDVVNVDQVKGEWTITCRDTKGAENWREFGEAFLAKAFEERDRDLLNIRVTGRTIGPEAVVSVDLTGLEALLEKSMRQVLDEGAGPEADELKDEPSP